MRRCKWCGCFVAADQSTTTRTVRGYANNVLAWRTFTQLLCPACSKDWSTDRPWNRAATLEEQP
jgi:hypothetical protein